MTIRSIGRRVLRFFLAVVWTLCCFAGDEAAIHVAHNDVGPRPLEPQTRASVVRDYVEAWQGLDSALKENAPGVIDAYFVGTAKKTLIDTIQQQERLKINTSYKNVSHNIKILFYSPEGLSIELVDDVGYQVEIRDGNGIVGSQNVHTRYIAVLTPTESKWKVRILQSGGVT
jgi:hypothetical protein